MSLTADRRLVGDKYIYIHQQYYCVVEQELECRILKFVYCMRNAFEISVGHRYDIRGGVSLVVPSIPRREYIGL